MYYIGRFIGYVLFILLIQPLRFVYNRRKCTYYNTEILEHLKGKSFFVASNHIKPRSKFLRFVSFPYDAFIARKMFMDFGFSITAMTSYDAPRKAKSAFVQNFRKYFKDPLTKGIVESIDLVPVNRSEHDNSTIKNMKSRMAKQPTAFGIFPEGTWFRGFRNSRKLYSGVAIFSKRYDLPILPIYMNAYNMNGEIDIRVGNPIFNVSNPNEVMEAVRKELILAKSMNFNLDVSIESFEDAEMVFAETRVR